MGLNQFKLMLSITTQWDTSEFESMCLDALQSYNVPGMSIAISKKNQTYYQTFGLRDASKGLPLTKDIPVRIASLTKQFFSYIVLDFVNNGKLELDIPLSSYLPDYVDTDHIDTVTTRHVLSHTTGFPNWCINKPLIQEFKPGSQWQYSGEGFSYLQHVVSEISGKSLHDLIHEMIFAPLELNQARTEWEYLDKKRYALPHDKEGKVIPSGNHPLDDETRRRIFPGGSKVQAAGSMWSTAEEYLRFMTFFRNQRSDLFEQMITHQIEVKPKLSWGLGIGRVETDFGLGVWQWGSEAGFKNFQITFPSEDYSIVVLTNGANGVDLYREIISKLTCNFFEPISMK